MSITTIVMLVIGAICALFGGMAGHGIGKASGKTEGAATAKAEQAQTQATATVAAVEERQSVETNTHASTDNALDSKLSEFDRPN